MDRSSGWTDRRQGRGRRLAGAAVGLALAMPALGAAPDDGVLGTYRMRGTAHLDAAAPVPRDIDARGDAVVRGGARGAVLLRLASMGQACEISASRAADGTLSFEPGQRCAFDLADPGTRGHVQARLRTGRGRLRDRHLALDLAFDLSGSVALRAAAGVQVMGVELPSAWTPDIRLDGGANVRAEGDRDESRAAPR